MQHHPDAVLLVEADFDEVIARAESAQLSDRPELRALAASMRQCELGEGLSHGFPGFGHVGGGLAPSAPIVGTAIVGATVGYGFRDRVKDGLSVLAECARIERSARRDHAAVVNEDAGGKREV